MFFAGEATCGRHWATVHGAYVSGAKAAAEILNDSGILPLPRFTENRRWRKMMLRATRFVTTASASVNAADAAAREKILGKVNAFSSLRSQELKMIATLFTEREFAEGAVVFRSGEAATEVYVIIEGYIDLELFDGTSLSKGSGEVIGEYGMFGKGERSLTGISRGKTRLLSLDYRVFRRFLLTYPEAMLSLYGRAVDRLVKVEQG